ncbi:MAG: hypothetical protein V1870_05005 [Candidatus Aenigmatarchaeota archaeon]
MVDMITKPRYDEYMAAREAAGWEREHFSVDELNTNMVTLQAVGAGVTNWAIDMQSPAGQIISVLGGNQVSAGADLTSAYPLVVRMADSSDNEISFRTKVRITKESLSEATKPLERTYYSAINNTKIPGTVQATTTLYKTNSEHYRFSNSFELLSNQRMRIYVINTVGTVATPTVSANIPTTNISFALTIDLWTRTQ